VHQSSSVYGIESEALGVQANKLAPRGGRGLAPLG
jgi:hypothetical protein